MRKRRKKVRKQSNLGALIVIGAGILVVFLLFKERNSGQIADAKNSRSVSKEEVLAIEQNLPSEAPLNPSNSRQEGLQEQMRIFNTKVLTGLKEIPVTKRGKDLKLMIRTKAEAQWCRTGDFDLLKSLVDDSNKKIFLLSVEALYPGNEKVVSSQSLSLLEILKGKPIDFVIPLETKARDYGIYLCLDSKHSKECSSKSVLAGNQWDAVVADGKSSDKVLYFQSFSTRADKAYLIPSSDWGDAAISTLVNDLKPTMEDSSRSLNILATMMKRLGSLGAIPAAPVLEIPLPYRDPRCGEKI